MSEGNEDLSVKAAALEGVLLGRAEGKAGDGATGASGAPGGETFEGMGDGFTFEVDLQALVADTLELLGETFAPYWFDRELPEDIRITRPKVEKLSHGYLMLAMKYLPGFIEKYPLEFMVLVQTAAVVRPILKAGVPLRKPKASPVDGKEKESAG